MAYESSKQKQHEHTQEHGTNGVHGAVRATRTLLHGDKCIYCDLLVGVGSTCQVSYVTDMWAWVDC